MQILCHRLGWFLLKTTYQWEGDKKSCTLLGYASSTPEATASAIQTMSESYPSTHIAPFNKSGSIAVAGSLFKWSPQYNKLKLGPVVNCSVEPAADADSMTTRAGMHMLANCPALLSYNVARVQDLRAALDRIATSFKELASLLYSSAEAVGIFESDDIEGFFNACRGSDCVADLKQVLAVYKAQFPRRDARKHFCYVSKFRSKPVLPGNSPQITLDSSYTIRSHGMISSLTSNCLSRTTCSPWVSC